MKSPLDYFRKKDVVLDRLKPADAPLIARLHSEGFHHPWSDGEFRSLLGQGPVFGFIARPVGEVHNPVGFVLARLVAGEAEILTIAVARSERRAGLARKLMTEVLRLLHQQRAESLFLEVDEANAAAVALYRKLGFHEVAKRPSYYQGPNGRTNALVMRLDMK